MSTRVLAAWCACALAVALLTTNPVLRTLVLLVALTTCVTLARPGRRLRPLLLSTAVAALVAVPLNALLSHTGRHVLVTLPDAIPGIGGVITLEAIAYGAGAALGIAAAVLSMAPLGLALEAHQLIDALPRPLERTATALAAAVNMVPGMARTYVAVRDAQRLRGRPPRGPRAWSDLLLPVTLTTMEDSLQLAETMEARGYGSGRRTAYRSRRATWRDGAVLVCALAALGVALAAARLGGLPDWYPFPTVTTPPLTVPILAAALLLAAPIVLWQQPSSTD